MCTVYYLHNIKFKMLELILKGYKILPSYVNKLISVYYILLTVHLVTILGK